MTVTMRQVMFDTPGDPQVMRVGEAPVPEPGPGQVLIRVHAAGVNRPDILQRRGLYDPPPGASPVLGLEAAGDVVAVGPGVDWPPVGEAVCALTPGGAYAEFCLTPAAQCLPVPRGLEPVAAACIPETYFTVWTNVFDRGRLQAGESLLIHGGSSGIGTTAIQLARLFEAVPYVTVGTAEKARACVELGAQAAINYKEERFEERVLELTSGRGVDLVLDIMGGDYVPRNLACLAEDGRLVQIAWLDTARVEADFTTLMTRRLTWTGSTLRPQSVARKAAIAASLREHVWPAIETGRVGPVMHASFPLEQVVQAHALMESSAHIGKIALLIQAGAPS